MSTKFTGDRIQSELSSSSFVCTVEPLLYDHPQNHIGVVVLGMVAREGFVYVQKPLSVTRNVVV